MVSRSAPLAPTIWIETGRPPACASPSLPMPARKSDAWSSGEDKEEEEEDEDDDKGSSNPMGATVAGSSNILNRPV